MNILGWEPDEWKVDIGHGKGPDYRIKAEFTGRGRCTKCGTDDVESKGKRTVTVWDTRMHGRRVQIEVTTRQWKCRNGKCPKKTFVYRPPELAKDRLLTSRLLEVLRRESFLRGFKDLEREYGVSATTVSEVFEEELKRRFREWEPVAPRRMGVDEIRIGTRRFVVANLATDKPALVEILKDRKRKTVEDFLSDPKFKRSVEVVAMDMWRPYRRATRKLLPEALIVADKFHVLRAVNRGVDRARELILRYPERGDRRALKGSGTILRKRAAGLKGEERKKVRQWRAAYPALMEAYDLKESFYDIYLATDRMEAGERLDDWVDRVPRHMEKVFNDVIRAVGANNWRDEILNYFEVRETNARTEAVNRLIRETWRLAKGCRFEVLRAKMLYSGKPVQKFWESEEKVRPIPGSIMGYQIGGGGGTWQTLGADIEALVADMTSRSGEWADPDLWTDG